MERARQTLTTASHKLAEAMYKATTPPADGAAPGAEPGTPPPAGDAAGDSKKEKESVIDAEYVDVDEKKK